ncbi:MAG: His/Gly/Thr/Pro-type tRNA ligase C-terminal domain-containing protein [Candidatus Diapherotrites archaeon]|nr:His/Gly/Thr/Pro-type tRNA ligase C-terminal domain-containing protein [Candidatus Diapherotrites archaeon]
MPTLIPEGFFKKEAEHIDGFTPEVYWVEKAGNDVLEERLALRPTSETAFYSMFALWIRSYKDLPFRTYQRAQVFRYESKATRPFLRSREFHWIETHCAFATEEEAFENVREDMETTKRVVFGIFGVPTIVFERPDWDKFPGAARTFGADAITPQGRVVQQPSTHLLKQHFPGAFGIKYVDKDEKEKVPFTTCYGPAISRIFASIILTHGDNKGLKFPFEIAPKQVVVIPILAEKNPKILEKAKEIVSKLEDADYRVEFDNSDKRPGEKFYFWEMKGVPLRIEIGPKEFEAKKLIISRRDTEKKISINEKDLLKEVASLGLELSKNLCAQAKKSFEGLIKDVKTLEEVKKIIGTGIARTNFCSTERAGEACAEVIEKETGGKIRGTRIDVDDMPFGPCVACGKKANKVVYIAKDY